MSDDIFGTKSVDTFMGQLDLMLGSDVGYALEPGTIAKLVPIYNGDRAEWVRIEALMRSYRVPLPEVRKLVKAKIRESAQLRVVDEDAPRKDLLEVVHDAPVPHGTVVPESWELRHYTGGGQHSLIKLVPRRRGDDMVTERIPVSYSPAVIRSAMADVYDGDAYLELAWRSPDGWLARTIRRDKLATSKAASEALCGYGYPIHANNAAHMIDYIIDYEAANSATIPRRLVSTQMGWQGDAGYLLGDAWIPSRDDAGRVEYLGADDGETQLGESLSQPGGTMSGWRDALRRIHHHPRAEVAIYASLAPAVLKILGAPNFIVEWCGQTSVGKTSAMMVAASVWGDPDARGASSFIGSWASTKVAIERRMTALCDLPVLLDDTKLARVYGRDNTIIPSVVYAAVNGQSDARGSITGTQRARRWRTIVLSTGEERLVDKNKSGGTVARVVTLWGSPFEGVDARADVEDIRNGLVEHYGHAGPLFVKWLVENKAEWENWRNQWRTISSLYAKRMADVGNDIGVSNRVAGYVAVLELVARLAHRAIDFPWDYSSPIEKIVETVGREARTARRDREAIDMVASWIASNVSKLQNGRKSGEEPHGGWFGYWPDSTLSKPWDYVALYPVALRKLLRSSGYEPNAIIRQWLDSGRLRTHGERVTAGVTVDGTKVQMVCIKRSALEEAGYGSGGSGDLL